MVLRFSRLFRIGWGLAALVWLSGFSSGSSQSSHFLLSEGTPFSQRLQRSRACSPQLLVMKLLVAGADEEIPEQAVVDEAIAELEHRLESLGVNDYQVSQGSEDSINLVIDSSIDTESLVSSLALHSRLEIRPQRVGTEAAWQGARWNILELQAELALAEEANNSSETELAELHKQIAKAQAEMLALSDASQLTAEDIDDAYARVYGASGAQWVVGIKFSPDASERFAELTRNLAGTGRSLGIFVNGELVSDPTIGPTFAEEGITGGEAEISGNFGAEGAKRLASQLKTKPLQMPLKLLEQQYKDNPDCPGNF